MTQIQLNLKGNTNGWYNCKVISDAPSPSPEEDFNRFTVELTEDVKVDGKTKWRTGLITNVHPDCIRNN